MNGWLTLTRKPGQAITIGEDIVIHVVEIGHGKVTLSLNAPREIEIWRSEIKPAPGRERRVAA